MKVPAHRVAICMWVLGCLIAGRLAAAPRTDIAPRLDHLGIVVKDADVTARFLTEALGFRRHSLGWEVDDKTPQSGGLKLRFLEGNGMWFTLIEPTSPGPGLDELNSRGDGAISELDFEVDDLDTAITRFDASAVKVVNFDGKPFPAGQRGWTIEPYGLRLVYLATDGSHGIPIEVYQRGPVATDILHRRDRTWIGQPKAPADAPRFSHVTVAVRDADVTGRFFGVALNLQPPAGRTPGQRLLMARDGTKCRQVDAHGVVIELVQPPVNSPAMRVLNAKGDGHPAELVYAVPDLRAFLRKPWTSRAPVPAPSHAPAGDRFVGCTAMSRREGFAELPLGLSQGMHITLIGR